MIILGDYNIDELKAIMVNLNEPSFRAKQLFTAIAEGKNISEITNIPESLKLKLLDYVATGVKIREKKISHDDGTIKYLFELFDGNIIEGVLMNYKHGNTLCLSTQIGCRMNCAFCASGLNGLIRNLSAGEMLGQVVVANRDIGGNITQREITNIVLMGSGEPLDNYDNTVKFLKLVISSDGINIGPRHISLSTCGLVDKIMKFTDEGLAVNLTISLHSPFDEMRTKLMPINKAYNIEAVMKAARHYFDVTGRRVIIEYALIDGVNDSDEAAKELVRIVRGFPCHINLIKLNYVKEKNLKGSKKVKDFLKYLEDNKVSATIRRTMGGDIEGACGQLRRRYLDSE